ncbi:Rhodanase, C-terminal [Phytophthora cactorum]|nr:Rhodanase, C-terminal [Phytophthora cactorum]
MLLRRFRSLRRPVRRCLSSQSGGNRVAEPRQYVSLYNYVALEESELPKLRRRLLGGWKALGDLPVPEGINGQLVLPQSNVAALAKSFPQIFTSKNMFYGQLMPAMDETKVDDQPFLKLTVKIRKQLVHDGFQKDANLQEAGIHCHPTNGIRSSRRGTSWMTRTHLCWMYATSTSTRSDALTEPQDHDTFEALDEILVKHEKEHDGQKPKEVMMYCTGGIRCEKVGAYLTQYKGISNVQKLHGGSTPGCSEARARSDDAVVEEISLFKGKNFVFDQRCVGELTEAEEVTDDVLGQCSQCGEPCNHHTNCSNLMCHGLILQCSNCATSMLGACSEACKQEYVKMESMTPDEQRNYRKANALKWKPKNPNSVSSLKYIKFRPASPELLQKA